MKLADPVQRKRCNACRSILTVFAFRKDALGELGRRAVCKRCEVTARTAVKKALSLEQQLIPKIRRSALSHAKRVGLTLDDFLARHPWEFDWMARDASIIYQHGYCPRCHIHKFSEHPQGDFTLDVIFPELPPYQSNLRWVDRTCNTRKGKRAADEEAHDRSDQQQWEAAQITITAIPVAQPMVFSWMLTCDLSTTIRAK